VPHLQSSCSILFPGIGIHSGFMKLNIWLSDNKWTHSPSSHTWCSQSGEKKGSKGSGWGICEGRVVAAVPLLMFRKIIHNCEREDWINGWRRTKEGRKEGRRDIFILHVSIFIYRTSLCFTVFFFSQEQGQRRIKPQADGVGRGVWSLQKTGFGDIQAPEGFTYMSWNAQKRLSFSF